MAIVYTFFQGVNKNTKRELLVAWVSGKKMEIAFDAKKENLCF